MAKLQESEVRSYIPGRRVGQRLRISENDVTRATMDALSDMGVTLSDEYIGQRAAGHAAGAYVGDSIQGLNMTTANIGAPIQFLQSWLPGFVYDLTYARKIDEIAGIMTAGSWEDAEIVQGILERTGGAVLYSDAGNVPLANFNFNFERRSVVQFELGMAVNQLEEARNAKARVNSADAKRGAIARQLEIQRNKVGFNGFNSGNNRTYGLLNDPNLPSYQSISHAWTTGSYADIRTSIIGMMAQLETQMGGNVDVSSAKMTLGIPVSCNQYLNLTPDQYNLRSVREWALGTFKGLRIVTAKEFELANGGANVAYLYLDEVEDESTDGGQTLIQVVPSKFRVLGVQKTAKGYLEDNSNATAGVMIKRPMALVRYSGL